MRPLYTGSSLEKIPIEISIELVELINCDSAIVPTETSAGNSKGSSMPTDSFLVASLGDGKISIVDIFVSFLPVCFLIGFSSGLVLDLVGALQSGLLLDLVVPLH